MVDLCSSWWLLRIVSSRLYHRVFNCSSNESVSHYSWSKLCLIFLGLWYLHAISLLFLASAITSMSSTTLRWGLDITYLSCSGVWWNHQDEYSSLFWLSVMNTPGLVCTWSGNFVWMLVGWCTIPIVIMHMAGFSHQSERMYVNNKNTVLVRVRVRVRGTTTRSTSTWCSLVT